MPMPVPMFSPFGFGMPFGFGYGMPFGFFGGRFHLSVVHVGVCRERGEWVLQRRGSI